MSKRAAADTSPALQASSSLTESTAATPTSTPSSTPSRSASVPSSTLRDMQNSKTMDDTSKEQAVPAAERQADEEPASTLNAEQKGAIEEVGKPSAGKTMKKAKCTKPEHKKKSKKSKAEAKSKKASKPDSSDDSSSSSSSSSEDEESDSDSSSSEDEKTKKRKAKKAKALKKAKDKKRKKSKKVETESESSESESSESEESESSSEEETPKKKKKSAKKAKKVESESEDADETPTDATANLLDLQAQLEAVKLAMATGKPVKKPRTRRRSSSAKSPKGKKKADKKDKKGSLTFKKVDQLWDTNTHQWTLKESAGEDESEFAEYAFLVRRTFDWENKYQNTLVDIKAKQLKVALAEVMKGCKSVSFEAEEPTIDPNLLFLYLDELRTHYKKTLKAKIKTEKKRKALKKLEQQRSYVKTLVSYIDEDYEDTKKTLYPLLKAGNITFDLLWALYKPNDIAITSCYGDWNEPRCFKIDFAHKFSSMMKGEWYCVEGKYMEYDGKNFGLGDFEADVDGFKGPRKITSLATYPLKYHKDPAGVKKEILERGKRFISMVGMNYRFHKGMAYMKKKKQVLKININGRVMVDPQLFRKINANYPISIIKPHEGDELFSDEDDDDDGCSCCDSDDEPSHGAQAPLQNSDDQTPKIKYKLEKLKDNVYTRVSVEVDDNGDPIRKNKVDPHLETGSVKNTFTEEELLLTSPVVLGFAFSEKLWLEFSLSGICDIEYNEDAFDSLVLPHNQKSIVRALVESHKFHAAKTIDDVVQGKGKGLVAVLHGPPGTGKTLTAEGISELLKCPLYMVSAGELGTDPGRLESELQKILDIAHAWGAVLLLDEADVFLEKRETHDIHRNALVSIFLRLLEYFQGILFLTTNRVETFDDAFQSRIHVALRYGDLTAKAKKAVWKMFIELCRRQPGTEVAAFSEAELDALSRRQMNGRQIKNAVRTAQALALNEGGVLGLEQIRRVLDVAESFERDLKGGTGYEDAMRSYT